MSWSLCDKWIIPRDRITGLIPATCVCRTTVFKTCSGNHFGGCSKSEWQKIKTLKITILGSSKTSPSSKSHLTQPSYGKWWWASYLTQSMLLFQIHQSLDSFSRIINICKRSPTWNPRLRGKAKTAAQVSLFTVAGVTSVLGKADLLIHDSPDHGLTHHWLSQNMIPTLLKYSSQEQVESQFSREVNT